MLAVSAVLFWVLKSEVESHHGFPWNHCSFICTSYLFCSSSNPVFFSSYLHHFSNKSCFIGCYCPWLAAVCQVSLNDSAWAWSRTWYSWWYQCWDEWVINVKMFDSWLPTVLLHWLDSCLLRYRSFLLFNSLFHSERRCKYFIYIVCRRSIWFLGQNDFHLL